MYSQQDIDAAVTAGAIDRGAADRLRAFVAQSRETTLVDEEHFRLLTGFNDIFVALAATILLFALGAIGNTIGSGLGLSSEVFPSPLGFFAVTAAAWALGLYFTKRRRMALPSIVLLLFFAGSLFGGAMVTGLLMFEGTLTNNTDETQTAAFVGGIAAVAGAITALGAWLHWRAFRVPITVAAGAAGASAIIGGIVVAALASAGAQGDIVGNVLLVMVLLLGVAIFAYAMKWDTSDPSRITRRSDVAFWLHLLAAPMIAHPIFALLGLTSNAGGVLGGLIVIAIYIGFGIVALAVDRRALLVSALIYVLIALNIIFERFGAVELNIALTALVIGSSLLTLSALWHQARVAVVSMLPESLRARLPSTEATGGGEAQPATA